MANFKDFKVFVQLFWNASNTESIVIRSKNKRNAKKLAIESLKKKYNTDMIQVLSIKEIN